jgi:hypothetical protein
LLAQLRVSQAEREKKREADRLSGQKALEETLGVDLQSVAQAKLKNGRSKE